MHEDAVARVIRKWGNAAIISGRGCSRYGLKNIIEANRDVAQARTHLASIGPREGRRTKRLWSQIGKIDKRVKTASDSLMKCIVED